MEKGHMCRTKELRQLWRETHCPQSGNDINRIASHLTGIVLGTGGQESHGFTS